MATPPDPNPAPEGGAIKPGVSAAANLPTLLEPMPAPTGVPPDANRGAPVSAYIAPPGARPGLWAPGPGPASYPNFMTGLMQSILGGTPTSLAQIRLAPYGSSRPSRTSGPLTSGPMGGTVGSALLALPLWIDYSMGNFSLPVPFPPGSILLWVQMTTYAAWAGGTQNPTVALGTASGLHDIFGPAAFPAQHVMELAPMTGTLPFATDPNPWQAWLTIAGFANTSGAGFLSLIYGRF